MRPSPCPISGVRAKIIITYLNSVQGLLDEFLFLVQSDIFIGKFDILKHNRAQNVLTLFTVTWKNLFSKKMKLFCEHFRAIFHNFRRGLSRQECIDELNEN